MYRVGRYLDPLQTDPSFAAEDEAMTKAKAVADKDDNAAIAVWDVDETKWLFLGGETFRRD